MFQSAAGIVERIGMNVENVEIEKPAGVEARGWFDRTSHVTDSHQRRPPRDPLWECE